MTDDAELLASAYLDGDVTDEERARVEADPELLAEVQRLVAVREALADVEPARPDRRDAQLAAALSAWEEPSPAPVAEPVEPPGTVPAPVEPVRRPAVLRWTAAAAAALLLVVAAGVLVSRSDRNGDDVATDAPDAETESGEEAASAEDTESAEESGTPDAPGAGTEAPAEEEMSEDTAAERASEDAAAEAEMSENTEAMAEEGEESAADVEVTEEPIAAEADDAGTRQADVTPGIVRVQAYDAGSDDAEDDPAAAALAEADSSATWSTECSADPQPGGTQVVGLVVTFDRRTERPLIVDVQSAPSQIQFYAATTRRVPSTLEQWGAPVGAVMVEALPAEVPSPPYGEPVRHVLVVFDEMPSDPGCADTEPYRGTIGDVRPAE